MKSYKVVETRSVFTHRYLVELEVTASEEQILQHIIDGTLEELMQRHDGETIYSITAMTEDEIVGLDNDYMSDFNRDRQIELIRRTALKNS